LKNGALIGRVFSKIPYFDDGFATKWPIIAIARLC
jgi:hypothetical protein